MALSDDEQREIESLVKSLVLKDFRDEFQEIYSYAVAVLEVAPEQANNEIRNALNHISRALDAESLAAAREDVEKAAGHFERAKRDSLKLANIHLHEQIKSDLLYIETIEGSVPFSIKQRLATLEQRGADTRRGEARGEPGVTDKLADLFADQKQFRDDIHKQFIVPPKAQSWLKQQWTRTKRNTSVLITGMIIAIVGRFVGGLLLAWYLAH